MKMISPESLREDDVVYLQLIGECRAVDQANRDGEWVYVTMDVEGIVMLMTFHWTERLWWTGRVALPDDTDKDLAAPL